MIIFMRASTSCFHRFALSLLLALSSFFPLAFADDLQITRVAATPKILRANTESASISFHLNKTASVNVKIFDARDILIWQQSANGLPAGDHLVQWSGVNQDGQPVEPEAYFYVLEAMDGSGEKAVYDLTDVTGGESVRVDTATYDAKKKMVKFTAPGLGRYFIRAGVSQSFAVNTLINNEVLPEGNHELRWDGFDASHTFSVAEHPKLLIGGFGYRLSDNAIVVRGKNSLNALNAHKKRWAVIANDSERREKTKIGRANVDPNFYRGVDRNRDVVLKLALPSDIQRTSAGIPIIQGATAVRVELAADDAEVMEAQRGEMVFFWDSQLIYDNEVSYYPYTFNWKPPILDGQTHLLTAFVAGFGGNVALATIKVQLGKEQNKSEGR